MEELARRLIDPLAPADEIDLLRAEFDRQEDAKARRDKEAVGTRG